MHKNPPTPRQKKHQKNPKTKKYVQQWLLPQLHHSRNRCKEISLPKVSIQEGDDWRKQKEKR